MSRRQFCFVGAVIAGVLLFAGCATVDKGAERRALYVDQHPELSDQMAEAILGERITVGMTKEAVVVSWGQPSRMEKVQDLETNLRELWIYGNFFVGGTITNLYFDADQLLVKYEVLTRSGQAGATGPTANPKGDDVPVANPDGELSKGPPGGGR